MKKINGIRKYVMFTVLSGCFAITLTLFSGCGSRSGGNHTAAPDPVLPDPTADQKIEDILHPENINADLRFDESGNFKLLIFSDLRLSANVDVGLIDKVVKAVDSVKPSLVLFGGDLHDGSVNNEADLRKILDAINAPLAERKIPWCHAFGVDAEGLSGNKTGYAKTEQQKVYCSYPYCISGTSDDETYGVSNYVLPVKYASGDKIGFNIWCLDANGYLNDYVPGLEKEVLLGNKLSGGTNLDCIHFSQRLWYWNTSFGLQDLNGGELIPGIMYFQVPPYQFRYIFRNPDLTGMTGKCVEKLSASERDSGIVWTCAERGDIKGIFCGYNRKNNYAGTYLDMLLASCSSIGNTGSSETAGARVVNITGNGSAIDSYMLYASDLN